MSAETYDLLVSLLGSALAGFALFVVGILLGFLIWGGTKRKAELAQAMEPGSGDRLEERSG